jgi:multidrug efflux pump subunit AcrA (membrane-fusion protein)
VRRIRQAVRAHRWLAAVATVVVIGVAAGGSYWYLDGRGGDSTPAAAVTTTRVETVSTTTLRQSVSASGTISPAEEESVNFAVSGTVTSVLVAEGDTVTKGQKLATVDPTALQAAVTQAEASVASAQAKVSDEDSDASAQQISADKASLTVAQNQLAAAKEQLAEATLTSPISGIVADLNLSVGTVVGSGGGSGSGSNGGSGAGSGSSTSSSSTQVLVVNTSSWVVNTSVDATQVGLIKAGDQAELSVSGVTSAVYGTISSVALLSSSSGNTPRYPVVIGVTGSPSGIHDGASVTATLIYKQIANAVVVPTTAVHTTGGSHVVYQMKDGKQVTTTVEVGIESGAQTQITSGLSAGDQIVVPQLGQRAATNGGQGPTEQRSGGTGEGGLGRSGFGGNGFGGGEFAPGGGQGGAGGAGGGNPGGFGGR